MKQNYKLFGFAAMAALLFSGCSKDATDDVVKPGEETFTLVIIPDEKIEAFSDDGSGTRTYWDEEIENVKWSGNEFMYLLTKDQYRLVPHNGGAYSFDYDKNAVGDLFVANVPFLVTGIIPEELYKHRNITDSKYAPNKIGLTLPSAQESTAASFDPWLDVMIGSKMITITEEEEANHHHEENIPFARVMAISKYDFSVTNEKLSADESVESIALTVISGEGREQVLLTGSYYLDISTLPARCINRDGQQINLRTPFLAGSATVSTTYAADAQPKLGELAFWPITAPVKLEAGDQLRFRIVTNAHEITKTITLSKDLYYTNAKLNRATVKLDADTKVHSYDEAIDLSAEGTANSYIVNKPRSTYKFRADVKGNGIARSMGDFAYTEADLKIEPKAAVVVWYNTVQTNRANWLRDCPIVLESVKLVDNYIEFSTPETFLNGNILIAVIDQPLAADEITVDPETRQFTNTDILWSWNLICSDGYDINDASQTVTKGGYTFMTRDLGAVLDASETLNDYAKAATQGNMYQWGRKDPFPTLPDYASNDAPYMTGLWFTPTFTTIPGLEIEEELGTHGKVGNQVFGNTSAQLVTNITTETVANGQGYTNEVAMDFATKLPYRWLNASASGVTQDQRWYWIRDYRSGRAIWGNPDGQMELKTIYDPCPAGWKVASEKAWLALTDDLTIGVIAKNKYFYFSSGLAFPVWIGRDSGGYPGSFLIGGGSSHTIQARYMTSNTEEFYGLMPHYFYISALRGNYDQYPEAQCKPIGRDQSSLGSRIRCIKDNE